MGHKNITRQASSKLLQFLHGKAGAALVTILLLLPSTPLVTVSPAIAGSISTTMNVTANVINNCTFTQVNSLQFGAYDNVNQNQNHDATTTIQLRCTKNTTASIGINTGLNAAHASRATRAMHTTVENDYLSYEIYTDPSRTTVWNTSSNRVSYTATSSAPATINVYGRIPPQPNVRSGTYSDTVTITATF